jgi:hypothetical protein
VLIFSPLEKFAASIPFLLSASPTRHDGNFIAASDRAGDFETRAMSTSDADQGSASATDCDRFETAPALRRPCGMNPTRRMRVANRGGIGLTIDLHFCRSRRPFLTKL